jgi:hypothetical protein
MSDWKQVYFYPWIGERYENSRFGMRVLVLGESHYKWEKDPEGKMKDLGHEITKELVEEEGGTHYFFKKIPSLFWRAELSDQAAKEQWLHLAFYNYIQEALEGPKQIPTHAQWKSAEEPFREVLERLRPSALLVLGARLWAHTPNFEGARENEIVHPKGPRKVWRYEFPWGDVLASSIHHPSARNGWTVEEWRPVVDKLLHHARGGVGKNQKSDEYGNTWSG